MSKKKSNQAQTQRAKKQGRSQGPKKNMNSTKQAAHKRHVKDSCSILDPFCIHAKASRRPDGLSTNTIPFQVRGSLTVATDANGRALTLVVPGLGKYGTAACTDNGTAWVPPAAWTAIPGSQFITTNFSEVRIVSMGVKIIASASMTDCQGIVHLFNLTSPLVGNAIPRGNHNNTEDKTTPLTAGYQESWIAKPLGSAAHSFIPIAQVTDTMSDFNWTSFGIEIEGGKVSTTVLYLEVVVNVEGHLNPTGVTTTGLGGSTIGARPANPLALQVQSAVHATLPSFIEGGVEQMGRKIEGAAASVVSSFLDSAKDFGLGLLFG